VLAHSLVEPKGAPAGRYMLFLHGILGTRANWRGIARRFVKARPNWGAVLVDLREHGDSLGEAEPHTLVAAAVDVKALTDALSLPIGGALGHSFGGKVVLEWLRSREGISTEAWIVDSSPSASPVDRDTTATAEVLRILSALPKEWGSREAFIAAVTNAGEPVPIAKGHAKNLRRTDDGRRVFGPDLEVIHALIADYARTDLWSVVESLPRDCTLDAVIGGRSTVFSSQDRTRLKQAAKREPRLRVHVVEQAGHWVHVDAADALVALLAQRFASPRANGT
jgi:esterase